MNLEAEILKEHSKRQSVKIAKWVGNDPKRFEELMNLFLRGEYRVTQRSAWIVGHCAENYPELITPWLKAMIAKTREPGVHDAVKRNVVRILQNIDIPTPLLGTIVSLCFDYLTAVDTPIAVKVFSMTVLANVAKRKPDLKRELKITLEHMLPYSRAALCARGRMVLKQLSKK
jgi:hypothetical protein